MAGTAGRSWESLGAAAPSGLTDARGQLHHAAQIVTSVGKALLPRRADDSHTNFEWLNAQRVLATQPVPGQGFRAALRPADLTLALLDGDGALLESCALHGRKLADGVDWLARAVESVGGDGTAVRAAFAHDIPPHAVAMGQAFALRGGEAFAELAGWYANADLVLRAIAAATEGASDVRCWPHHFDIATLVTLSGSGERARTVGMGMTPGDESYNEPYLYVTPWPYPKDPSLPPLEGGGTWHTRGWTGAVLTGSAIVAAGGAAAQEAMVRTFLAASHAAARRLVEQAAP